MNPETETISRNERRRYILSKNEGIQDILLAYLASVDYANQALLSFGAVIDQQEEAFIIDEMNRRLLESESVIQRRYEDTFNDLTQIGLGAGLGILAVNGIRDLNLDINTRNIVKDYINTNTTLSELPLSQRIWDLNRRTELLDLVRIGIRSGQSTYSIAQELTQYLQEGKGFQDAYRLAYTETTHAHAKALYETAFEWNQTEADFKLLIHQFVSPMHRTYDICDVLAGYYDPTKDKVPVIPRHPLCNCDQELVPSTDPRFKATSIERQLRSHVLIKSANGGGGGDSDILKSLGVVDWWQQPRVKQGLGFNKSSDPSNAGLEFLTKMQAGGKITDGEMRVGLQALVNYLSVGGNTFGSGTDNNIQTVINRVDQLYGIKPVSNQKIDSSVNTTIDKVKTF